MADFDIEVFVSGSSPEIQVQREPVPSPFTILVDGNEIAHGYQYKFLDISSDADQGYAPIKVKTKPDNLYLGDYSIAEYEGVCIERKTKADLFMSMTRERANFEERIILMSEAFKFSAVVIECNASDIYTDPPFHTEVSPKVIYRSILSWMQRYSTHWIFCGDRDFAEQTVYRILAQYHESQAKPRGRFPAVVESFVNAFRAGADTRFLVEKSGNMYKSDNPLSVYFRKGWEWASGKMGGNQGILTPFEKRVESVTAVKQVQSVPMHEFPFEKKKQRRKK